MDNWTMKRIISFFLVTILATGALTSVAHASPANGMPCTQVGSIQGAANHKLICTKSGKKLVWEIPPTKANANNSSSQTTATMPSSTKVAKYNFSAPIPITLPATNATSSNPITFENIINRVSDIPTSAYTNQSTVLNANMTPNTKYDIFISPDIASSISTAHVSTLVENTMKMYSGFQQPPYFAVYIYDYAGTAWAKNKYEEVSKARNYSTLKNYNDRFVHDVDSTCRNAGDCGGTNASTIRGSNEGYLDIATNGPGEDFLNSPNIPHSYIHLIQKTQWDGTQLIDVNEVQNQVIPFWLFEGGSQATPVMLCTRSLQNYLSRRNDIFFNFRGTRINNLTAQTLTNYLNTGFSNKTIDPDGKIINSDGGPGSPMSGLGNPVGGLAVEALTAISGPQSVMALTALVANGNTMADAFQKVYGITWNQGLNILGQVLSAEYAANAPRT
jgi:hypothetical protein